MGQLGELLKQLWPLFRVRLVALAAEWLVAFAKRSGVKLDAAAAAAIAALVVELVEELINREPDAESMKVAASALATRSASKD